MIESNEFNQSDYESIRDLLLNAFDKEYIRNMGNFIYGLAEDFLAERNLTNTVVIDKKVFFYCLIDMLVDIARLRYFHNIDDIS